jgi:hypothetical protein
MHKSNRDLLVLLRHEVMSEQSFEREVDAIHQLLFETERLKNIVRSHELMDLNQYKIIRNPVEIKRYIRLKKELGFNFLYNLN